MSHEQNFAITALTKVSASFFMIMPYLDLVKTFLGCSQARNFGRSDLKVINGHGGTTIVGGKGREFEVRTQNMGCYYN
jgi:hypothetical protein